MCNQGPFLLFLCPLTDCSYPSFSILITSQYTFSFAFCSHFPAPTESQPQWGQIQQAEISAPFLQTGHVAEGMNTRGCLLSNKLFKNKCLYFSQYLCRESACCKLSLSGFLGCKTTHTVPLWHSSKNLFLSIALEASPQVHFLFLLGKPQLPSHPLHSSTVL